MDAWMEETSRPSFATVQMHQNLRSTADVA